MKSATTVFLSHASDEAELAAALCELLESRGVSCWVAPRDVKPGRPYAEECVRGIEESAWIVWPATRTLRGEFTSDGARSPAAL